MSIALYAVLIASIVFGPYPVTPVGLPARTPTPAADIYSPPGPPPVEEQTPIYDPPTRDVGPVLPPVPQQTPIYDSPTRDVGPGLPPVPQQTPIYDPPTRDVAPVPAPVTPVVPPPAAPAVARHHQPHSRDHLDHDRTVSDVLGRCDQKGTAPFHWLYHKCGFCGSYNTRVIKVDTINSGCSTSNQ